MISLRKIEYQEFLQTTFWQEISYKKKEQVGFICESCGRSGTLHCHHKFYRKSWFATRLSDLIVLCEGCHLTHHKNLIAIQSLPKYKKRSAPRKKRIHKKIKYQNYLSNCFSKRECNIQIRY